MSTTTSIPTTPATTSPGPGGAAPGGAALEVSLDRIRPSRTNPRKHFEKAALAELADSIRAHGILQPILVRPIVADPPYSNSDGLPDCAYEVVAGERRYRAATQAGLETIPVVVRNLGDAEALELQVIENLQRSDLHPLEEAEGYEQLQRLHEYAVEDLAAKVGKSKGYVYARIKLLALIPKAREAFRKERLNPSTALLLARIPVPELQLQALQDVTTGGGDFRDGPMSVREAAEHIQEQYMLRLSEAPFASDDAALVARAGPCTTCPNRTGNQRELFGDIKSADVCTDPTCFKAKREAWQARARAEAEATGRRVIAGKEAKKIKPHEYSSGLAGHVRLSDRCYDDPKNRTYQQLLGKHAEKTPLLEDPHTKELVPVVSMSDATKALKEKGHTWAERSTRSSTSSMSADHRRREEKARTETTVRRRIHEAIRAKVGAGLSLDDVRLVAQMFFQDVWDEHRKRIMALWGWTEDKRSGRVGSARARIAQLSHAEVARLLLDLAVITDTHCVPYGDRPPTNLLATAKRYKVDADAIRRGVLEEVRAKAKEKASKPGTKGKKSAAGKKAATAKRPVRSKKASPAGSRKAGSKRGGARAGV
jgi:ParB/RepB/Spo0J family partition protein